MLAMLQPGRSTIAILALLLAMSAHPSAALLVCMSADGQASLEFAAPGTVRCADADCEGEAERPGEHSCRDIPVLSAGQVVVRSSPNGLALSAVLPALATAFVAPAPRTGIAPPVAPFATASSALRLRSVILTL
jgi:hypothetical protein